MANTPHKEGSPPPSISFYILTDGAFGESVPDFADAVKPLLRHPCLNLGPTQVVLSTFLSITIIQFGENPEADVSLRQVQQNMRHLDG
jgi:hypothetical protein